MASGQVLVDGRGSPDWIPVTTGPTVELDAGMVIATRVSLGRVSGVVGVAILGKGVAATTPSTITSAGVASEEASVSSDGSLSTPQAIRMNNDAIEMATNLILIFIRLLSMFQE